MKRRMTVFVVGIALATVGIVLSAAPVGAAGSGFGTHVSECARTVVFRP